MTKRAAIILAGGKAKRFQTTKKTWQDKALAELNGKPLLVHAVENVLGIVDEVVVVVDDNKSRMRKYQDVLRYYGVKEVMFVADLKVKNLRGPLIAILTGLKFMQADYCITVPADVPMLHPKVAKYLFEEVDDSYVAVPMWPNGRLETLLLILERQTTLEIVDALCQLGRSHPDDIIRGASKALFVSPLGKIKSLDPELCSFININSQEDLNRLQPRQGQGADPENLRSNLGDLPTDEIQRLISATAKRDNSDFLEASKIFSISAVRLEKEKLFFWSALSREYEAKSLLSLFDQCQKPELIGEAKKTLLKAAQNYGSEAKIYERNHCYWLVERARADKSWCEMRAKKLTIK